MFKILLFVYNYQQKCVDADQEQINKFIDGNIEDFISENHLEIPCGVKTIEQQINQYPSKQDIQTVTIPDSVIYIQHDSFQNCTNLINITIPDSVVYIGEYAFSRCTNLQQIILSNQLKQISSYTFFRCSKLIQIVIPDSVIKIGVHVFYYCTSLESVTLPKNLQILGSYSFYDCQSLKSIVIPNSVQSIDSGTFSNCSALQNITIPQSVILIEMNAFQHCVNLNCVHVVNNLADVNQYAFDGTKFENNFELFTQSCPDNDYNTCDDQYTYIYDINTPEICIKEDYVYAYYSDQDNRKIQVSECPEEYEYMIMGQQPKQCVQLCSEEYQIRDYQCQIEDFPEIVFTNETLGQYIDQDYTLTIPEGIQVIIDEIYNYEDKDLIKNVIFPNSLIIIGYQAFYSCYSLMSITIPEQIQLVDSRAFAFCWNMTQVQFNNKVKYLHNQTFYTCSDLVNISGLQYVQRIYNQSFDSCRKLQYIDLSTTLEFIGEQAFGECYKIQSIDLSGVQYIGKQAFQNCTTLDNIVFSNSIKIISNQSFYNCSNLKNIQFSESIEIIEYGAFQNCTSLEQVIIPSKVTTIDKYTFNRCTNLKQITLPSGLKTTLDHAFSNCTSLETIYIPETVESLGWMSFANCLKLYCAAIYNESCEIQNNTFQNTSIQNTYMNNMGQNAKCFEYGYGYCDNQTFTYIEEGIEEGLCANITIVEYYYIDQNNNYVRVIECPNDYIYQYPSDPIQCVYSCLETDKQYQEEIYCKSECEEEYVYPIEGYVCNNSCTYYFDELNIKHCIQQCNETYPYLVDLERDYCVQNCSTVDQFNYQTEFLCTSGCYDDYAYQYNSNICNNTCLFYKNRQQEKHCVSECSFMSGYEYYVNNGTREFCVENCSDADPYIYTQDDYCVINCTGEYAKPLSSDDYDCDDRCAYQIVDGFKICVGTFYCPNDMYYVDQEGGRDVCTNTTEYFYQSVTEKVAVDSCPNNYKYQLPNTQPIECVNNCSRHKYDYIQGNICSKECTGEYAYPSSSYDEECSNTCMYYQKYIFEDYIYCVSIGCPDNFSYIVNKTRKECVKNCSKQEEYNLIQEDESGNYKYCVNQCLQSYEPQNGTCVYNEQYVEEPENPPENRDTNVGLIVGVVIAVIIVIAIIIGIIVLYCKKKNQQQSRSRVVEMEMK